MPVRACAANQLLHRLVEKSPVLRNFLLQIVECGRGDGRLAFRLGRHSLALNDDKPRRQRRAEKCDDKQQRYGHKQTAAPSRGAKRSVVTSVKRDGETFVTGH